MENAKQIKKLKKYINKCKSVFLMSHKDLDLDALGSCIGLFAIIKKKKKKCYIIVDDQKHEKGVEKVLIELDGYINVIKSGMIEQYLEPKKDKNLLIVLDTNKQDLVQNKEILKKIEKKFVIDHHENNKNIIKDAQIINNSQVSSTCEIVTSLIELYDIDIEPYYATVLLAGIVVDTNNFTLKTTSETFYSAYYLSSLGASAKKVQYLLKQDIAEYTERQKLLTGIETINGKIAVTKAAPSTIYRKEDLAKVADTLLFFNNIEASFVIGKVGKDAIGISARSLGNYEIVKVLEKIGGGGDNFNCAARLEHTTISKVEQKLKKLLNEQEGK